MNRFGEFPQRTVLDFKLLRTKKANSLTTIQTSFMNDSVETELNVDGLHKVVGGTEEMYAIKSIDLH